MKPVRKILSAIMAGALTLSALSVSSVAGAADVIKVACCGDSITQGWASSNLNTCSYPAQLQDMLGDGYDVRNYGSGGLTAMKDYGSLVGSYWTYQNFYSDSKAFQPDVVILKLGTNDAVVKKFGSYIQDLDVQFEKDLFDLVQSYQRLDSNPVVYLCTPMTAFDAEHPTRVQNIIVPAVKAVAEQTGATLLDFNAYSADYQSKGFTDDGIHPNDKGYIDMAGYMYENVFGGVLRELTVITEPGNIVSLGGQTMVADSEGKAVLLTGDGEKSVKVEKNGVGFSYVDITVDGDTVADVTDSVQITVNLGLLPTTTAIACDRAVYQGVALPQLINDSDESTGWQLDGDGTDYASGVWVGYDFSEPMSFDGMEVVWEQGTRAPEGQYKVEISNNGTTWTTLSDVTFAYGADRDGITFGKVTARYVRIACQSGANGKYYPKVYELRVYQAAEETDFPGGERLIGDINLDGEITAADLTAMARHVGGIEFITNGTALLNSDMDVSGGTGADDMTLLARKVAGIG